MQLGGELQHALMGPPPHQAQAPQMGGHSSASASSTADYLAQLLKDKKQLAAFPNVFLHMERLLDDGKLFFLVFIIKQFKALNSCYKY